VHFKRIPQHVAIIMDGNGRWAQARGHRRVFGHIRGSSRVKAVVKEADRLGVKVLTLYAFSTENWGRPEAELQILWRLLKKYLLREIDELDRNNVQLLVIGQKERLSADVRDVLDRSAERLARNTGLKLVFAVSYGSRVELVRAARLFAQDCVKGRANPDEMSEELMREYLWTSILGELDQVDLVIRTSGEKRISNFLLWQAAYAELVFSDLFWPDFTPEHLRAAVGEYAARERRFGGVGAGSMTAGDMPPAEVVEWQKQ